MNDGPKNLRGDFETASVRLEAAVLDACGQCTEWPAKVAAGIYAALDFAAADEPSFSRFVVERHPSGSDEQRRYAQMIDRFAGLLSAAAPPRHPASNGKPVIRSVAAMIAEPVRSGRPERLTEIGPELVQLVLQPYLSFEEAKGWADRTSRSYD